MALPTCAFPLEQVTLTTCFRDEALLQALTDAGATAALPKVSQVYGALRMPMLEAYPYTFASLALTMDGKMAFPETPGGVLIPKSNKLNPDGALADFFVLNALRAYSDAVINGTNTLRAEPDLRMTICDPELAEERSIYLNKTLPHPLQVIISLDGQDIPFEHPIFHQDDVPVCVCTSPAGMEYLERHAQGNYVHAAHLGEQDLEDAEALKKRLMTAGGRVPVLTSGEGAQTAVAPMMRGLKQGGIDHILIESPTFMWLLMREKLLHEIYITHTTVFLGGQLTPGLRTPFTFTQHPQGRIAQLNRHGNAFLYSRQILEYSLMEERQG
ncbi:MAG: dihydrofolate reductase family protein [Christensenellaceae bacterium]|jgi:riboflavin biosynthesis pyrimidine reductase|nr:dihydrofolate reductase family protein [Christensenellaceae bacterium]